MKIEDNFIDQENFDKLQSFMWGSNSEIFWIYSDAIVFKEDKNRFKFVHVFYEGISPCSSQFNVLSPILEKINPISLYIIKANLLTRTPEIVENGFHVDIGEYSAEMGGNDEPEKLKQWTTSIFYVNTNNGYTEFEDGTKVESVANRLVTFPSNLKHRGTSCTDEKIRVLINFNYLAR